MELKRETICENTLEFIQEYYRLNTGPLFSVLSDDCVWLGPGESARPRPGGDPGAFSGRLCHACL